MRSAASIVVFQLESLSVSLCLRGWMTLLTNSFSRVHLLLCLGLYLIWDIVHFLRIALQLPRSFRVTKSHSFSIASGSLALSSPNSKKQPPSPLFKPLSLSRGNICSWGIKKHDLGHFPRIFISCHWNFLITTCFTNRVNCFIDGWTPMLLRILRSIGHPNWLTTWERSKACYLSP